MESGDRRHGGAVGARASWRTGLTVLALVLGVSALSQWWQSRQADAVGRELAARAQAGDIRMISSVTCGFCTRARLWMDAHQVRYAECFIERDVTCRQQHEALMLGGTPVVVVRGQAQLGFSAPRVLERLKTGQGT